MSKCRKQILADLDVTYITDFLLETKVVDDQALRIINAEVNSNFGKSLNQFDYESMLFFFLFLIQPTTEDRSRRLLEILPSRGSKAFSLFVEALKEDYDWLADSLEEEAAACQYEVHMKTLGKSTETYAYENRSNSLQEENVRELVMHCAYHL